MPYKDHARKVAHDKDYYRRNKNKKLLCANQHYADNKEAKLDYAKRYYEKNSEAIKSRQKECSKNYLHPNSAKRRSRRNELNKLNSRKVRNEKLKNKYNITLEQYETMLAIFNRACCVCGSVDPRDKHGKFHVDHCHTTGEVRGLLCAVCNRAIGMLGDDVESLQRAADYLRNPPARSAILQIDRNGMLV